MLSKTLFLAQSALMAFPAVQGMVTPRQDTSLNLRVLPLGASITYGYADESANQDGYRGRLREDLVNAGYTVNMVGHRPHPGTMIDNGTEGHPGARVGEIEERARFAMDTLKPNLVLINVGTNNCGQVEYRDPAATRDDMENIMNVIWENMGETSIFLSSLLPNGNDADAQACVEEVNGLYSELAAKKAGEGRVSIFVDMSSMTTDDLFDGIHPTESGYIKMGDIWADSVLAHLSDGTPISPPGATLNDWVKADGNEPFVCPAEICDNIPPEPPF